MHFGFFSNQFWSILLTWPAVVQDYSLQTILYSIYFLVFLGISSGFLRTNYLFTIILTRS
jgi:hypothetical protein